MTSKMNKWSLGPRSTTANPQQIQSLIREQREEKMVRLMAQRDQIIKSRLNTKSALDKVQKTKTMVGKKKPSNMSVVDSVCDEKPKDEKPAGEKTKDEKTKDEKPRIRSSMSIHENDDLKQKVIRQRFNSIEEAKSTTIEFSRNGLVQTGHTGQTGQSSSIDESMNPQETHSSHPNCFSKNRRRRQSFIRFAENHKGLKEKRQLIKQIGIHKQPTEKFENKYIYDQQKMQQMLYGQDRNGGDDDFNEFDRFNRNSIIVTNKAHRNTVMTSEPSIMTDEPFGQQKRQTVILKRNAVLFSRNGNQGNQIMNKRIQDNKGAQTVDILSLKQRNSQLPKEPIENTLPFISDSPLKRHNKTIKILDKSTRRRLQNLIIPSELQKMQAAEQTNFHQNFKDLNKEYHVQRQQRAKELAQRYLEHIKTDLQRRHLEVRTMDLRVQTTDLRTDTTNQLARDLESGTKIDFKCLESLSAKIRRGPIRARIMTQEEFKVDENLQKL